MDLWFTDGSGINDCFDVGIYGPMCNYKESIPMDILCTVFLFEVMDILRCAELLVKNTDDVENTDLLLEQASFSSTCKNHFWFGNVCKC